MTRPESGGGRSGAKVARPHTIYVVIAAVRSLDLCPTSLCLRRRQSLWTCSNLAPELVGWRRWHVASGAWRDVCDVSTWDRCRIVLLLLLLLLLQLHMKRSLDREIFPPFYLSVCLFWLPKEDKISGYGKWITIIANCLTTIKYLAVKQK